MTDSALVKDERIRDMSDPAAQDRALDEAAAILNRGGLVVLPTDTVYGIGAAASSSQAVAALLAAKGRGRTMPPPVLVADVAGVVDVVGPLTPVVAELAAAFWPGPLTLVLDPVMDLDLGDATGVAIRVPDHPVTLALLARTGPLAVSSANRTGIQPSLDISAAIAQFGDAVDLYLDAGIAAAGVVSTIVDGRTLEVLRDGAIGRERLHEVVTTR